METIVGSYIFILNNGTNAETPADQDRSQSGKAGPSDYALTHGIVTMFGTSLLVEANRKVATICNAMNDFHARDVYSVDCSVLQTTIFGLVININCAEVITE